jgi:DNA-binding response OmpR family regulator
MIESEPTIDHEARAHSIHLLDDDSDWLLFFFEYLSGAGYHVTASSTIDDALILLARSQPEILIADRDISGSSEIDLLDRVRSLSPVTRVILTAKRSDGQRSGGADVLLKPIDWSILRRAVERAVQQDGSRHLVE